MSDAPSQRPNILFLLSDEHSFRYMGHARKEDLAEPVDTPTFDRLAAQGTRFTDTYCQMPLCTPSRICMLTGKSQEKAGAWNNGSIVRPELSMLPRHLAAQGYATCLIGKMHLGGDQQFVGFQHRPYGDITGQTGHQWEPINHPDRQGMRERTSLAGVTGIPESLIQEHVVAEETLGFLREHTAESPEQPWMLCASFSRPHFPLTAPKRWIDRYWPKGVTPPPVPAAGDAWDHPMSVGMRKGFIADQIEPDEAMYARAAYFACVSYLDEIIGDMLVRLEAAGLLENTIIIYTSDHGELAGEHGVWWKNGWYEGCARVPLLVSTPEHRRGDAPANVCESPVSLADLFPTCCGFAGLEKPEGLDGVDLSPTVRGQTPAPDDRPIFTDNFIPRWGAGTEFRAIRYKQFKYVVFRDAPPLMFDVKADPGEQRNLLKHELTDEAAEARRRLESIAADVDFDQIERLRSERDGGLAEQHPKKANALPGGAGNCYLLPDGRLISADNVLYDPAVLAENAAEAFGDWPGKNKAPAEVTN